MQTIHKKSLLEPGNANLGCPGFLHRLGCPGFLPWKSSPRTVSLSPDRKHTSIAEAQDEVENKPTTRFFCLSICQCVYRTYGQNNTRHDRLVQECRLSRSVKAAYAHAYIAHMDLYIQTCTYTYIYIHIHWIIYIYIGLYWNQKQGNYVTTHTPILISTPDVYDDNQCYKLLNAFNMSSPDRLRLQHIRRSFDKQHGNNVGLVRQGDRFTFWIWSKMQHVDMYWSLKYRSMAGWWMGRIRLKNEDAGNSTSGFVEESLLSDNKWTNQIIADPVPTTVFGGRSIIYRAWLLWGCQIPPKLMVWWSAMANNSECVGPLRSDN